MSEPTDLQRDLKKREPFSTVEEEVFLNLTRTLSLLERPVDRLFADHGISSAQYNVLRILRGAGPPGLPCLEVSARMVSRLPDITRLVDRLVASGHVARSRSTADRRIVMVELRDSGRRLVDSLDDPLREIHHKQLGHMGRDDLQRLNALLVLARRGCS